VKAALALLVVLTSSPAYAASCKENPALTEPCDTVRGAVYEGPAGLMFQMDVHKQNLSLEDGLPVNLAEAWEQGSHARVKGVFEVCPLPSVGTGTGALRRICIESADELSIINVVGNGKRRR